MQDKDLMMHGAAAVPSDLSDLPRADQCDPSTVASTERRTGQDGPPASPPDDGGDSVSRAATVGGHPVEAVPAAEISSKSGGNGRVHLKRGGIHEHVAAKRAWEAERSERAQSRDGILEILREIAQDDD